MRRLRDSRLRLREERRIPVALILDVLHVARITVGLVLRNDGAIRRRVCVAVVTDAARLARRRAVERRAERFVTTRTRQLARRVAGQAADGAYAIEMQRVELADEFLILILSRPRHENLSDLFWLLRNLRLIKT